jgi:hypothetical protein
MLASVSPGATGTGTLLQVLSALPDGHGPWVVLALSPPESSPQQYAAPVVVTAHVLPSAALAHENFNPPATRTGIELFVKVPFPSSPYTLLPQQYAAPTAVTAQVCSPPEVRNANVRFGFTVTAALPLMPSLVAVTVVEPGATAVNIPSPVTLATAESLVVQDTVRPASVFPAASLSVAVSGICCPATAVEVGGFTITVATGSGPVDFVDPVTFSPAPQPASVPSTASRKADATRVLPMKSRHMLRHPHAHWVATIAGRDRHRMVHVRASDDEAGRDDGGGARRT